MNSELELLLKDGYIGFYTRCEVIEIFGYNQETTEAFNIFTIFIFEYSKKEITIKPEFLLNKLQEFSPKKIFKWGIYKRALSIKEAISLFNDINTNNKYRCNGDKLNIAKLERKKKAYSKPNNVQINYLLKNNYNCGSYIIEFFDCKKENINFILNDPVCLNNLSERISYIIPISIGCLSDRLGNIIFQLPINKYKIKIDTIKPNKGIRINFITHKKYNKEPSATIITKNSFDGLILDSNIKNIQGDTNILIPTSSLVTCDIFDENDLLIYEAEFNTLSSINTNIGMISHQYRNFLLDRDMIKVKVQSNYEHSIGNNSKDETEWVLNRKYDQELKNLENNKSFIQYYGKDGDADKSINDIRSLINLYGKTGVYLWDPFLNSKDIKKTLYYCKYLQSQLRAITGLKQDNNKETIIKEMANEFGHDDKQYLLLNLEVRGRYGTHGFDFHDRFLIFPQERPKVWSLGISVNQLGKSHHILQEVKHAQHILNAFNTLWQELNHEECIIWKSR